MDGVLARKPLTPAELSEPPCKVCVTGAAGYIASHIVCRLLAAGHTVHATFRENDDPSTLAALRALPNAGDRISWFEADLMKEGSFDAAIQGCKYVIHTAAPVSTRVSPANGFPSTVTPSIRGMANVLGAASRGATVERVVATSSLAAIHGGLKEHEPGHVLTEADWNLSFGEQEVPYFTAKTLSEWQAWALASQQSRWSLVTINPAAVVGPPLAANKRSEAVDTIRKLLDGSMYPFVPPLGAPTVDIADVAAAHCLAMITPEARGRYLLCESSLMLTEIAAMLRRLFPNYWVPYITAPFWLSVALLKLTGTLSYGWIKSSYGRKVEASSAKALAELKGLGPLIPLEQSLKDMGEALTKLGLVTSKK